MECLHKVDDGAGQFYGLICSTSGVIYMIHWGVIHFISFLVMQYFFRLLKMFKHVTIFS